MTQEKLSNLNSEISEFKHRALKAGYKQEIPHLHEEFKSKPEWQQEGLLQGFNKRFSNWKRGLIIQENPGGLPSGKKPVEAQEIKEAVVISTLVEHFNGSAV